MYMRTLEGPLFIQVSLLQWIRPSQAPIPARDEPPHGLYVLESFSVMLLTGRSSAVFNSVLLGLQACFSMAAPTAGRLSLRDDDGGGCYVYKHTWYNSAYVFGAPTDQQCDVVLNALRRHALAITNWKCEQGTTTFRLTQAADSVSGLAGIIQRPCRVYIPPDYDAGLSPQVVPIPR